MTPPKIPMPWSPEPVNILKVARGKKDFPDVIKVRILRSGNHPGLPGWARYNHSGLYKGDAGGQSQKRRCDDEIGDWSAAL